MGFDSLNQEDATDEVKMVMSEAIYLGTRIGSSPRSVEVSAALISWTRAQTDDVPASDLRPTRLTLEPAEIARGVPDEIEK